MHVSDYALVALAFFYCLNLGPMMFESFTSDRTWASDPPDSFHMFRGPYGQKTAHYWRIVTPLAGAAFVLSLVLNWSAVDRRLWLFAFFVAYLAVQIPTMAYFVPEQEKLISDSGALGRELCLPAVRTTDAVYRGVARGHSTIAMSPRFPGP